MAAVSSSEPRNPKVIDPTDLACVCGGDDLVDLGPCRPLGALRRGSEFESDLSESIDPGHLYQCRRCFLGLRLPRPDDRAIAALYRSLPATRWKEATVSGTAPLRMIERIRKRPQQSLRVLDIGAFDGSFLRALPPTMDKSAIEPSDAAGELERHGIQVLKSFLEPATPSEAEQFDLVTMFDVFEHLADPIQGMKDAFSYVRPGGRLVVGTGNMDHWSWRQQKGFHWYLDPIQHVVIGSQKHFRWQAQQLGAASYDDTSVGHQDGTITERFGQAMTTVYFTAKSRGGVGRALVRVMNLLPHYKKLSHKQAVPYTQKLHDHILAEFVRGDAGQQSGAQT